MTNFYKKTTLFTKLKVRKRPAIGQEREREKHTTSVVQTRREVWSMRMLNLWYGLGIPIESGKGKSRSGE